MTGALLAALALAGAAPADAAERGKPCTRSGSKTIVSTSSVRVYETGRGADRTLHGCRRRTGRPMTLDRASSDGFVQEDTYDRVQVAGDQVTWVSTVTDQTCKADCPPGSGTPQVRIAVANLVTRRRRALPADPIGDAIVLSRGGGVAWAARSATAGATEVRASVREGDDRVLDSGAIDPASLRIEITIASWIRDGVERFARVR